MVESPTRVEDAADATLRVQELLADLVVGISSNRHFDVDLDF